MQCDWDSFRMSSTLTLREQRPQKGRQRVLEKPDSEFQSKIQNRK
jgi:hypothetical protein